MDCVGLQACQSMKLPECGRETPPTPGCDRGGASREGARSEVRLLPPPRLHLQTLQGRQLVLHRSYYLRPAS